MQRNLEQKNLWFLLSVALGATLFFPTLFPNLRLMFFAPFIIVLNYQKSILTCLWSSLFCGLLLDLLSSKTQIGLYAVSFCMASWILYGQRRNFFSDRLSTLSIMTFLFSICSTAFQVMLLYLFGQEVNISWGWALTDLVYMPAWDAFYAFAVFILPAVIFGRPHRSGKEYFFNP